MRKKVDKRALSMLTDELESFELESVDGEKITLYLYPLQLGRLMLISKRLLDLDVAFESNDNDIKKMWSICSDKPNLVAEIIAIATLRTKNDIENSLRERTDLILNSPTMTPQAIANVLMSIVFQSFYADFLTAIRSVRTFQVEVTPDIEMERIANMGVGAFGAR